MNDYSKCHNYVPFYIERCQKPANWFITTNPGIVEGVFGICNLCKKALTKEFGSFKKWVQIFKDDTIYLPNVKTYEDALETYRKYIILL